MTTVNGTLLENQREMRQISRNRSKTIELNTEDIRRIQDFHELFRFSWAEKHEIEKDLEK
jgi:hypothetical protein